MLFSSYISSFKVYSRVSWIFLGWFEIEGTRSQAEVFGRGGGSRWIEKGEFGLEDQRYTVIMITDGITILGPGNSVTPPHPRPRRWCKEKKSVSYRLYEAVFLRLTKFFSKRASVTSPLRRVVPVADSVCLKLNVTHHPALISILAC